MRSVTDIVTLRNGYTMPCVGFGTWKTPDGDAAINAVTEALNVGYRHIDTAAMYKNESGIGEALRRSNIPREELFLTSKVWNTERGYDKAMRAFEDTVSRLGVEYLDLYLIHWPAVAAQFDNWEELNLGTWKALTTLYKEGRIRSIGVSNFKPHHLRALVETEVMPMVNQIEYHPGYMQRETVDYCRERNIVIEAWSPIGRGRLLDHPLLNELAEKYGKSVAQLCLRWCLQNDTVPLPKSVTPSRIAENATLFDFVISPEDMARIDAIPDKVGWGGHDSDLIDF